MKTYTFLVVLLLVSCKPELEQVHLEVNVSSGLSGSTLEGYEVWFYGPETMIATIDEYGKATFDFEAPEGETYLVEFNTNFENFNPQGIPAVDWSPILKNEKLSDTYTVGQSSRIDLLAIPSSEITIFVQSEAPEEGDSLHLEVRHELFTHEFNLNSSNPDLAVTYSGPIGEYSYAGTVYSLNDTNEVSGSFKVLHGQGKFQEIYY